MVGGRTIVAWHLVDECEDELEHEAAQEVSKGGGGAFNGRLRLGVWPGVGVCLPVAWWV